MDALKIAFETVFVGVLALPWLALAAQFFFPEFSLSTTHEAKGWLARVWTMKSEGIGYAVVAVLSVAMAYTIGAAVSRLAEDFFNDDDLLPHVPTEDQIRASVYCGSLQTLVEITVPLQDTTPSCPPATSRWFRGHHANDDPSAADQSRKIFNVQEAALLLQGEDKVSKIRLLHQQLNVLRGVAFDGLLTCLLCLLGWNVKESRGPWRWKWWRWVLPLALLLYAFYTLLWNHLRLWNGFRLELDDPPFMELTLLLLAAGGCWAARNGAKGSWPQGSGLVSFLLAAMAYCGWYWTEILYDQLIIYSFYAAEHPLLKLTQ